VAIFNKVIEDTEKREEKIFNSEIYIYIVV